MSDGLMEVLARVTLKCAGDDWDALGAPRRAHLAQAARIAAALDDAGYQIVPKRPTPAMIDAASGYLLGDREATDHVWQNMVEAAAPV